MMRTDCAGGLSAMLSVKRKTSQSMSGRPFWGDRQRCLVYHRARRRSKQGAAYPHAAVGIPVDKRHPVHSQTTRQIAIRRGFPERPKRNIPYRGGRGNKQPRSGAALIAAPSRRFLKLSTPFPGASARLSPYCWTHDRRLPQNTDKYTLDCGVFHISPGSTTMNLSINTLLKNYGQRYRAVTTSRPASNALRFMAA